MLLAGMVMLLAGMVTVMDGPETVPFNVGNPTEFTRLELAKMVQEVVNLDVKIVYKENSADDPSRRKPDITKLLPAAVTCTAACAIYAVHLAKFLLVQPCATLFASVRHTSLHLMALLSTAAFAPAPL